MIESVYNFELILFENNALLFVKERNFTTVYYQPCIYNNQRHKTFIKYTWFQHVRFKPMIFPEVYRR